jgi:8-oxo-dGTP diphosphatase
MYTPILATLGYVFTPDRGKVLLVHRSARPGDAHLGKYNGLGGKLERDEDIVSGMKRELLEEAQIVATDMHLAGTISWPGFGKNGEDWFGFLFRITAFTGTPPDHNAEGRLEWHDLDRVCELPLWDGDRYFLPKIFSFESQPFHGIMPYLGGQALDWRFSFLNR